MVKSLKTDKSNGLADVEINLVNYHFNNVCNMTFPPNSLAQQ